MCEPLEKHTPLGEKMQQIILKDLEDRIVKRAIYYEGHLVIKTHDNKIFISDAKILEEPVYNRFIKESKIND